MRILGLTGDIACGKSTVAKMLAARGAAVLDSDLLVHELYADPQFAAKVAALFSTPVLTAEGTIDRNLLSPLVFKDRDALRSLEQLVHPAVAELRRRKIAALDAGIPAVVVEAVKLLESGQGRDCEEIWCVTCAPDVQIARLMNNRGVPREAAEARVAAQPAREEKLALAGNAPLRWITNDGTLRELEQCVDRLWTQFLGGGGTTARNG